MLPQHISKMTLIFLLISISTFAAAGEGPSDQNDVRGNGDITASQPDEENHGNSQSQSQGENAIETDIAKDELAVEAIDGPVAAESYPNELVRAASESGHYIKIATPENIYQTLSVETVEDQKVVNLQAKRMGKVGDVVVNESGTETALVVKNGGFLGIWETEMRVPLEQVYLVGQRLVWETKMDYDKVKDMEKYQFNKDRYTSLLHD